MADNNVETIMSDGSEDSWTLLDDIDHESQPAVAASEEIDNEETTEPRPIEVEDGEVEDGKVENVLPVQPNDSLIDE